MQGSYFTGKASEEHAFETVIDSGCFLRVCVCEECHSTWH